MREIKFSYIYQHDDTGRILNKKFDIHEIELELMGECFIERYTLIARRQYTGLKDKNGVEIYEKDIWLPSLLSDRSQVVKYDNGKFNISDFVLNGLWECSDKGKVIGNIYENPELLR